VKKPSKSARRELIGPSRCAPRTPGWILVRIPSAKPDGSCRDAREALDTVAHWPWAKDTRYIGHARGYHLFERPGPDGSSRKPA